MRIHPALAISLCLWAATSAAAQTVATLPAPTAPIAPAASDTRVTQVELRDVPLVEALRLLSRQTGINMVASADAGKVNVSLFLQDVTAGTVIDELCKAYNLWYRRDEVTGVLRIMTVAEFQRDLNTFREEKTEVFTLLYPNVTSIATAVADLYGDRVQLSYGADDSNEQLQDLRNRLQRFDLVDQRSQGIGIFQSGGVSVAGNNNGIGGNDVSNGVGGSGFTDSNTTPRHRPEPTGNETAGTTDQNGGLQNLTPAQAQQIASLSNGQKLTPDQQAALDAYRRAKANIYITAVRHNNMLVIRTSDAAALDEIGKLVKRLDVPTPLVLLEIKVLSLDLSDGFNSAFDFQFSDGSSVAGGFTSGDILPPASDSLAGAARRAASLALGGSGITPGALVFQVVSESFRARLQLLEDKNRVTQLATPLLLTANNEVSRLFVGQERPIVRNISSQTVINNNIATTTPNTTIEFQPVGTTLLISPSINSDRTVSLRLLQENSSIIPGGATIPVVSGTTITNQQVDVVSAQTLSGTIVAKDDLTMAVGGLIQEEVSDTRSEVPVLGKLPLIGILFRRQDTARSRHELIILVRPHVLNTAAESEDISRKLVQELSIHPSAPDARGGMGTYNPNEVLVPNPPKNQLESTFRFHSVKPDDF